MIDNTKKIAAAAIRFHDELAQAGYTTAERYSRSATPVMITCPKGHTRPMTPNNFVRGYRCGGEGCSSSSNAGGEKAYLARLELIGAIPIDAYINSKTRIKALCSEGHEFLAAPADPGCLKCVGRHPDQGRMTFEASLARTGFTALSPYITALKKVKVCCPKGHVMWKTPNALHRKAGCAVCSNRDRKVAQAKFERNLEANGWHLTGEYVNGRTKVAGVCDKGHAVSIVPEVFNRGHRCMECFVSRVGFNPYPSQGLLRLVSRTCKSGIPKVDRIALLEPYREELKAIFDSKKKSRRVVVDHIVPLSWTSPHCPEQFVAANSPANLQILTRAENAAKWQNLRPEDIDTIKASPDLLHTLSIATCIPPRHQALVQEMLANRQLELFRIA